MKSITERFNYLIKFFAFGEVKPFARTIDIPYSTLHRQLKNQDDKLLLKIAPNVMLAYPSVRREWLLAGKGEPFDKEPATLAYAKELDKNEATIQSLRQELESHQNEIVKLREELTDVRNRYTTLLEESLAQYREGKGEGPIENASGPIAPGINSAAPLPGNPQLRESSAGYPAPPGKNVLQEEPPTYPTSPEKE